MSLPGYDAWKTATPPEYETDAPDDERDEREPGDDGDDAYDRWRDAGFDRDE